jgi:hypothetical protein
MEIKVEVLDVRMINGHLIELEHWFTKAANPEYNISKYAVHDRVYYALGHTIKELTTPKFLSSEKEARQRFDECILEYSRFDVGGPYGIMRKDRVITSPDIEINDPFYNEFINLNTNWDFGNFSINNKLTNSEDDTTVDFTVTIDNDKFNGRCHLYNFLKTDDIILANTNDIVVNLSDYIEHVDRIGRYSGFFEKKYGVSDELLREVIISKVEAFLRGDDPNEF